MTSCKKGFNTQYSQVASQKCADNPVFWFDIYGDTCGTYQNERFCNSDGTYNTWNPDWGTFNDVGNPDKSCCYCGGGIKFQTTTEYENCICPEGSTDIGGVCITTDPNKIIKQKNTTLKEKCIDKSPTKDKYNYDCNFYADNKICDPNMIDRKGENWNTIYFDSKLLENCCRCGGGETTMAEIPVYSVECAGESTLVDGNCVCPGVGTILFDGQCLCPGGSTLINNQCICPGGSTLVGEECICTGGSILMDWNCVCPGGSTMINNQCICPGGATLVGEDCICTGGSTMVNNQCICPGGGILVDGQCVCPDISTLVDGKCVCPDISTLVDGKCKCSTYRAIFANGKCVCPKDYKKVGESCLYIPDNIPSDGGDEDQSYAGKKSYVLYDQISKFLLICTIILLGYLMIKTLRRRT
jgi:hypothetical protein